MYEGSLCICCMSTDNLCELFTTKMVNNVEENYPKMLGSSLNIQISEYDGHGSICESCISRLRNCVEFKKQALKSLSILSSVKFTQLVNEEDINVLRLDHEVMIEQIKTDEDPVETSYSGPDDVPLWPEPVVETAKLKLKRPVGRSRKNPQYALPYEVTKDELTEGVPLWPEPAEETAKLKLKRPVGRPRKNPQYALPYKVAKDELTCRECGEEFPCNVTLKVHYNTHFRNFVCASCDKGFMTLPSLRKHEDSHLAGPFPCTVCHQVFSNINTLHSHKRYKHGPAAPFRCRYCAAQFRTSGRRLQHEAAAHACTERRYKCRHCNEKFQHSGERSKHIAEKHEVNLIPCPFCGVKFKKSYMRSHLVRRHNIGHGIVCTVCQKLQPTPSAHASHAKTHLGVRPFVCKLCSKAFTQKCTLKCHIASHIRRGQYHGDPSCLIVYKEHPDAKNDGVLSNDDDEVFPKEQHLDEALQSNDDASIELANDTDDIDDILLDDDQFLLSSDLH